MKMTYKMRINKQALACALTLALAAPAVLIAAEPAKDEHAGHHPEKTQSSAQNEQQAMQAMRERMRMMRQTTDPTQRMQMMEEQMKAMESMMDHCPMAEGKGGMKMMHGQDMHHGAMQDMKKIEKSPAAAPKPAQ